MKLSLNWIKQYTAVELSTDELVTKIGSQLGEVEHVEQLAPKYDGALIVKIVDCDNHPNADRLHVCLVDDGGAAPNVERDAQGLVQIVCGAPNVHADMLAVWLPPGVTVPSSYDKDPFVLETRELRGVVSNGMLASPKELALGDSHEGILEINPDEWSPNQSDIKPGASFAAVFNLNDTVIDIENKMFTHRPDLFGQLGLAREVAGITGQQFTSPEWYTKAPELAMGSGLELSVINEAAELVPRFAAVALKNVTVKPSPLWLQAELVRVGGKPINNIVDVTNYIMWLTAQPVHAYDYDKLRGHTLVARRAEPDEVATLLNGKAYKLTTDDIAIADAAGIVGLGGIMGGGNSEVSDQTINIVLECANFDMYAVRRSSMRHGLFTDALTRFSKGQSPLQNDHVLQLLIQSIQDVAGGEVASQVFDEHDQLPGPTPVSVNAEFINSRLGLTLSADDMAGMLRNVEFAVTVRDAGLTVTVPFWRTDIEQSEDVVEEVGRLYGFDKLPLELPRRDITPAPEDPLLALKSRIRHSLASAGANELLTYSFVPGSLLDKATQQRDQAFKLSNALSPDLQYYRLHGLPSLLDKVHANIKAGHDEFALFELNKGHNLLHKDDAEGGVPTEIEFLDLVYASKSPKAGAAFYHARRLLDALAADLGLECIYKPLAEDPHVPVADPYDWQRSAYVYVGDQMLGMVGELKQSVVAALKLPRYCAAFTIGQQQLLEVSRQTASRYQPLSRYPKIEQDMCFKVAAGTTYAELHGVVQASLQTAAADDCRSDVRLLDIYQRDNDADHKQITFRIGLISYDKTMVASEMSALLNSVSQATADKLGAERV